MSRLSPRKVVSTATTSPTSPLREFVHADNINDTPHPLASSVEREESHAAAENLTPGRPPRGIAREGTSESAGVP